MALPANVASAKTKIQASLTPTLTSNERTDLLAMVDEAQAIIDKKAEIATAQADLVTLMSELRTLEEA